MRIALIVPGFSARPDEWAIPALDNLAQTLAARHEVHVFSQRYPRRGTYALPGLTHHALGGGQQFGAESVRIWLASARAIIRQHRQTPFDILHAFWADEAGFSAVLAGRVLRRPVLVSLGGGELTRLPDYGAYRFLSRRLTGHVALFGAGCVSAGSLYQLSLAYRRGLDPRKSRLAPLGVDTHRFRVTAFPPGPPTIVQAASLLPVKNQALLLHSLKQARASIPSLRLALAGDGPLRPALHRLAERLGLTGAITWAGQRPYPEMPAFYQQGHVYLQTSAHESQGMAVLEAMACGLPVIGTPVGLLGEVASRPPQAAAPALAAQLLDLLTAPTARQQARQLTESRYNLHIATQTFNTLYQGLL